MRKTIALNDSWQFTENGNTALVNLPHTWNAVDGQDGGNDYYRGACVYEKTFHKPALSEGERVYLEIPGAAMSAVVYLNGKEMIRHEGGYSLFRTDLTDDLEDTNTLRIEVDNSASDRVYPQYADFTFYGGLYRGVNLIIVPESHFSLDYYGGNGLEITPVVSEDYKSAVVTVKAYVNGEGTVTFKTAGMEKTVPVKDGIAFAQFNIENVHLWNGLSDPYLYEMTAVLNSGDTVTASYGCRKVSVDPEKGFILNGKVYPLRGVSRHQDLKGKGNALDQEDHERDMEIILDLGANTLRLAHYQHAQEFYDLCDKYGLVVWAEIPYISRHMKNGRENTVSQMKELIVQNYNHPSIVCWGLSNEITAASAVDSDLLENHRILNDLCHEMDHTRFTTMADVFMLETDSELLTIPDVNSYNLYFGWYLGELEDNDRFFDEYHSTYPDRVIGFSEYGADANPQYQSPNPSRGDYTESYQAVYHEHILRMIEERPYLWATHVWNLFDFAADGRDEGGKHGENQKGLVTFDRKTKKDAYYLYKAAWNHKTPFVHLCGKRYVNRHEDVTEIKVYSNEPEVTLLVNGEKLETKTSDKIFTFDLNLEKGKTYRIEAVTAHDKDSMEIVSVQEPDSSYIYAGTKAVTNWFDSDEIDPDYYSIEDTLGTLRSDERTAAIVNRMMEQSAASRGDLAEQVKDNPALQKMLERQKLSKMLQQAGADADSVKQLNSVLQKIKK